MFVRSLLDLLEVSSSERELQKMTCLILREYETVLLPYFHVILPPLVVESSRKIEEKLLIKVCQLSILLEFVLFAYLLTADV